MLEIPQRILDAVVAQARDGAPFEVCGLLGGTGHRVATCYPMTNTDARGDHFAMDPAEQFAAARAMRAAGEELLAVYHSHPESPPFPSDEDIRLAFTPKVHHLIVSLEGGIAATKAFRIASATVEPVEITVVG